MHPSIPENKKPGLGLWFRSIMPRGTLSGFTIRRIATGGSACGMKQKNIPWGIHLAGWVKAHTGEVHAARGSSVVVAT